MKRGYQCIAHDEAKRQQLTAAQVRASDGRKLAELASVALDTKGFDWQNIRRLVGDRLERDETAAHLEAWRASVEAAIRALPGKENAVAEIQENKEVVVLEQPRPPEVPGVFR